MRQSIGRASYYVFAGGLAIMFLIPLVWTVVMSVSPHGATAQQEGYGFGNYQVLVDWRVSEVNRARAARGRLVSGPAGVGVWGSGSAWRTKWSLWR